jgi:hypothetical protein
MDSASKVTVDMKLNKVNPNKGKQEAVWTCITAHSGMQESRRSMTGTTTATTAAAVAALLLAAATAAVGHSIGMVQCCRVVWARSQPVVEQWCRV